MSNKTQFWQNGMPTVLCQSIRTYPNQSVVAGGGALTASWSLQATFFNQCTYDWVLFVGIVAGVGGAIILGTIAYAIYVIAKAVHDSMTATPTGATYTEMDRGDE